MSNDTWRLDEQGVEMTETKTTEIYREGYAAGESAGTWVFDGNTEEETYRAVLEGYRAGDPEIMDMCPAPLSGEWAGDPTPATLQADFGLSDDAVDDACTEYEQAFTEGFWDEVIRTAERMTQQ